MEPNYQFSFFYKWGCLGEHRKFMKNGCSLSLRFLSIGSDGPNGAWDVHRTRLRKVEVGNKTKFMMRESEVRNSLIQGGARKWKKNYQNRPKDLTEWEGFPLSGMENKKLSAIKLCMDVSPQCTTQRLLETGTGVDIANIDK